MAFFKRKNKKEQIAPIKRKKLGLVLSGGGLRGFAHLGAIKAFEEEGIEFDVVAGTSVGSLVGALYSLKVPVDELIAGAGDIKVSDIKSGFSLAPADPRKIGQILTRFAGDAQFEDCKRKFAAVACDLKTSNEVILDKGSLADAVSASCSAPFFFRPVVLGDMHLVDGGLKNNVPSLVAKLMGAEVIVTVDINSTRGYGTNSIKTWDVLWASFRIMQATASAQGLANSNILIAPDMAKFSSRSKDGWQEMIKRGYEAAKEKIEKIKELWALS